MPQNHLAKGQPEYTSWLCRSNVGAVQRSGKLSGPKEARDSVQFTKALAITLHLLYLLEKVECKPNQDMKHQSYCLSVPVTARMSSLLHMVVDTDHKHDSLLSGQISFYPGGQGALDCGADPDSHNFDNTPNAHRKGEQLPGGHECPDRCGGPHGHHQRL